MIVFTVIAWFFTSLLLLILLVFLALLILPLRYQLHGRWQEHLTGEFKVQTGICLLELRISPEKEKRLLFYLAGGCFKNTVLTGKKRDREQYNYSSNDFLAIFDRGLFDGFLKCIGAILKDSAPKRMEITGVLGFEDPSYTGLLAACRAAIPGILVEPDFTREVRDLTFRLEGRLLLFYIVFRSAKFIFSPQAWSALKQLRQRKKLNKKCNPKGLRCV